MSMGKTNGWREEHRDNSITLAARITAVGAERTYRYHVLGPISHRHASV